ncbi:MAG: chromate efflux transporter [Vicinamibacterales bacterium]
MRELAAVFLALGATAFGGPAAHIALMERELVERRRWIDRRDFLDLLAVANLIPGPTSTELAMHVGRRRGGWPGLVVAGVAFILPAALMVGVLAALYVRYGPTPVVGSVLAAVQPVVVIVVLQAIVPLGRAAITSVATAAVAVAAALAAPFLGEIAVLIAAGVVMLLVARRPRAAAGAAALVAALVGGVVVLAQSAGGVSVTLPDVAAYFARVGSLLFGSGYVLLPVLQGDLVERLGWLTDRQLLDAIATGQATPGPLFTTATFIGYLLAGSAGAVVATVAMFTPAFIASALSTLGYERLRHSAAARRFLDGVNAAAVALIVVVLITLARSSWTSWTAALLAVAAAVALFVYRMSSALVLATAAVAGVILSLLRG